MADNIARDFEIELTEEAIPPKETPAKLLLSRNRYFNIFWAGQSLSALGDAFAIIAMPLLVLQATGSVAQMGIVTALFGIGQFLAGLISGVLVDRVDRRRLMIGCDIARTLAYSLIPLGWWLLGPQIWLIYLVSLAGAALGMCFNVAHNTAVANLVEREQIPAALGRLQATAAIGFVVGPMLAGFISAGFGPAAAIGLDAFTFVISAISLSLIRLRRSTAERSTEQKNFLKEWKAGASFLFRHPVLRVVTLLMMGFVFLSSAGLDLFVYHIKHDLGQDDNMVGIVFGLASVGSILGALITAPLRKNLGFGICWLGGMVIASLALGSIGLMSSAILVGLIATVFTLADSIRGICSISLRQQVTPDHLLGRVTAVFLTFITVPGPIGAALLTAWAEHIGVPAALLLMGGVGLILSIAGIFTPARTRHPETIRH
jgi:MFS family permease